MLWLSGKGGNGYELGYGLAVNGENYGLNLDALFTGDTEVIDNPYADGIGPISREDFSEIVYMSTNLPDRVHLRGVLLRAAITYTFY